MSYKAIRKAVLAQAEELASQVHAQKMDYHAVKPALYDSLREQHRVTNSHARESLTCDAMARFHTRLAHLTE
ncbi:MAG TPA: hypothetical protein VGD46_19545 [Rhizobacter sp.]